MRDENGTPPAASPDAPPDDPSLEIAVLFLLAVVTGLGKPLADSLAFTILRDAGFFVWYYGPVVAAPEGPDATREQLWAITLALPFWTSALAFVFYRCKAKLRSEVGLSLGPPIPAQELRPPALLPGSSVGVQILLGCFAWLVLTPTLLAMNYGITLLYKHYLHTAPEEHPLTKAATSLRPAEWALFAVTVMAAAPLWEELLFRGVLQALFRKAAWGGHLAMALALAVALLLRRERVAEAPDAATLSVALAPALFVVALVPVYLLVWLRGTAPLGPALFGGALLFASVHAFAWPTPVVLFLLGLGLGWLAARSRSLIAPVVAHSLFNGTSLVLLLF